MVSLYRDKKSLSKSLYWAPTQETPMVNFEGKVAVITGAASGIGRALARALANRGARLVLADIEKTPLEALRHALGAAGTGALSVVTDVAQAAQVEKLAAMTEAEMGGVDLLFNNAGVSLVGPLWTHSLEDWQWVLGVNLWGVVHGIRAFVPRMLRRGAPAHIVNTASMAGFLSQPQMGIYNVSKHAVVTLTETLHHDLRREGAPIAVSLLCPGFVNTRIMDSARNRPENLHAPGNRPPLSLQEEARRAATRAELQSAGLPPEKVAEMAIEAVEQERFYVFPHPHRKEGFRTRAGEILDESQPTYSVLTA
jgi:NAD(P)-dependent dehydrogenase (short-subunit alcohol dehydrogenase family)